VDLYGPLIFRYSRSKGLQEADAAEVTQEVLFQVSRSMPTFDYQPEKGRFRDWLGTVTRNKLRRFLKQKGGAIQTREETGLTSALEEIATPAQDTEWTEAFNHALLQTALARIRPHFEDQTWRAFALQWLNNRAAAEVAGELGLSLVAVYVAKSRVLKRLQEEVLELADDSAWCLR
jgi:RNA polymerase sigma-70 factor (ECF subfamily)